MKSLIFYSTTDGHTRKVAQAIARDWQGEVEVYPVEQFEQFVGATDVDTVVVGASIRYGHFNRELVRMISRHSDWLNDIQSAFFCVNLTARKPGKDDPAKSPYIQKLLHNTGWMPNQLAIFAGRLVYPQYKFLDKQMIRFIMKLTGGCTDGKSTIEYTNWSEVKRFSRTVSGLNPSHWQVASAVKDEEEYQAG